MSNGNRDLPGSVRPALADADIDPFRAQHLSVVRRLVAAPDGQAEVAYDETESPLAWLARRKGRNGRPLIEGVQFQAGERLRGDFTRANLMPRVTSNWDASLPHGRRGQGGAGAFTDVMVAAREQVRRALDAVGPEFAGLLLDVCCFLKGLEDIERERRWPPRSGKVVLQLGLDRLARHYGLAAETRGPARAPIRTWLDAGSEFVVEL
ncbi:MAG: DNA replication protein [Alphaproteobacteria bacterium]|nr:MAG: DNA replication protein [Alphaproteobacteria bacterium]